MEQVDNTDHEQLTRFTSAALEYIPPHELAADILLLHYLPCLRLTGRSQYI